MESVLEPEDNVSDDDTDDVSDDDNMEDKEGPGREVDDKEDDGVDEKVMDEAQKTVSSVFSVLVKLLDREVGCTSNILSVFQLEFSHNLLGTLRYLGYRV